MKLEIRELDKRDHKKAVQFAVKGMHFDWYMDSKLLLNLYGRYFWYLSLARATQVIAAYAGDMFAGVLLAEIKGEDKKYRSFWKSFYVKVFDVLQNLLREEVPASMMRQTGKCLHVTVNKLRRTERFCSWPPILR